jgi:hypothetical protein
LVLHFTLYTHFLFIIIIFLLRRSKRASYKYAKDRGAVASRWCWLTTQISELDYKIRHFTDLRKHIRESKGIVTLEATGFEGQLPGNEYNADSDSENVNETMTCARARPFVQSTFRKRKLIQIANLHQVPKKAAKPRYIILLILIIVSNV